MFWMTSYKQTYNWNKCRGNVWKLVSTQKCYETPSKYHVDALEKNEKIASLAILGTYIIARVLGVYTTQRT